MEHKLNIYNTLSRKKELFIPLNSPYVGMYVCGPTVYGDGHLGHARPAITFDLLFRYLKHLGYKVRYVRNITDVGHLENDADEGEDKNCKKSAARAIRANGSSAILPQPIPQSNGSLECSSSQHRAPCFRSYYRTNRIYKKNIGCRIRIH